MTCKYVHDIHIPTYAHTCVLQWGVVGSCQKGGVNKRLGGDFRDPISDILSEKRNSGNPGIAPGSAAAYYIYCIHTAISEKVVIVNIRYWNRKVLWVQS